MLYHRIAKEHKKIEDQIKTLENKIAFLPPGKLVSSTNGKYTKWFQSDGHSKAYIPKSNRRLAEQLAVKKHLNLILADLKQEKTALSFYLNHHKSPKSDDALLNLPAYRELLSPYFSPKEKVAMDWMQEPYEQNFRFKEYLVHKTIAGFNVRSKSESMITSSLFLQNIPFRYECALQLDDITFYPDFTILHPHTHEIIYWEHFGKIDDYNYSKNAFSKLQLYTNHGIIPSINLIITFETKEHPLSAEIIEKIIEYYFL